MAQSSAYAINGYIATAIGSVSIGAISSGARPTAIAQASGFANCVFVSLTAVLSTSTMYIYAAPDTTHGIEYSKHVSGNYCPSNGKVYFEGGDYNYSNAGYVATYANSYRQETFALDRTAFRAANGGNTGWSLEYGYEGFGGTTVQPKHPDIVGWCWDSTRSVFWMVPGLMVASTGISASNAPGESQAEASDTNFIWYVPMKFDPAAAASARWTNTGAAQTPRGYENGSNSRTSIYDPANDRIYRLTIASGAHGGGYYLDIFSCASNTWIASVPISVNFGMSVSGADLRAGQRKIYYTSYQIADPQGSGPTLWTVLMDSPYTQTCLGPLPGAGGGCVSSDHFATTVWDSVNNVLIFHKELFANGETYARSDTDGIIYTYDPATGIWEYWPIQTTPSLSSFPSFYQRWRANSACFLPDTGEVLYWGGASAT